MSLTTRAAGWATRVSTGLGVTRWSRWIATMGVVAVLCLGVGTWAGMRWERGAQALSDVKDSRALLREKDQQIDRMADAAEALRQAGVNAAQDYRTAALRMESIANAYAQHDQAQLRAFDRALAASREPLLRDRTDLWTCDIGQQLLDHWNAAARGPGGTAADAGTGRAAGAAGAVRADTAGHGQPGAGADRQPR